MRVRSRTLKSASAWWSSRRIAAASYGSLRFLAAFSAGGNIARISSRRQEACTWRIIIRDQHRRTVSCQEAANANRQRDLRALAASYVTIFRILSRVLYHYRADDVIRTYKCVSASNERFAVPDEIILEPVFGQLDAEKSDVLKKGTKLPSRSRLIKLPA